MVSMTELQVGKPARTTGCLTRLIDVVNRDPSYIEQAVGFHGGRLARGYYLLLLKEKLAAEDVEFYGYTYLSGGRIGKPPSAPGSPDTREAVSQSLLTEVGPTGMRKLQAGFAERAEISGPYRLVKIVPRIEHDQAKASGVQYPPGRGVMQVNLINPKLFLVAAEVQPSRRFHGGLLDLDTSTYDARHQVVKYLEAA